MRYLLTLCFFLTPVFAQRELINVFEDFNNELGQWCPVIENFDLGDVNSAINWICSIRPTITRASDLMDQLLSDTNGFFSTAINDGIGLIADATGWEINGVDLGQLVSDATQGIAQDIENGSFLPSAVLGRVLSQANQAALQNLTAPPDPNAPELEQTLARAAQHDPGRLASELATLGGSSSAIMQAASAQDAASISRDLVATSLARGDEEQLLKRVTSPDPLQIAPGSADRAEDLAFACVSTRCVAQSSAQMQTEFARQMAVSSANITTAIKEQMQQQSLTTQGIATLAQQLANQQVDEYNQWQKDYYEQLALETAWVNGIRDNYQALAAFLEVEP